MLENVLGFNVFERSGCETYLEVGCGLEVTTADEGNTNVAVTPPVLSEDSLAVEDVSLISDCEADEAVERVVSMVEVLVVVAVMVEILATELEAADEEGGFSDILPKGRSSHPESAGLFWQQSDDLLPSQQYFSVRGHQSTASLPSFPAPASHLSDIILL